MRIYMQTPISEDQTLRFYHLLLQRDLLGGWMLTREWGLQGSSGRSRREHYDERDAAVEALIAARDAQIRRGYRVVFANLQDSEA